jgi:hypothetical protein
MGWGCQGLQCLPGLVWALAAPQLVNITARIFGRQLCEQTEYATSFMRT